ncbi:thiol:disulfide interchange protein [Hydrogenophaga crassostreae]|uniref:Thiol:disulfide interchange protein DsbD n=1 Tax=Hydrogenophaga crassostreae TaxID=1763535 RepID=A0A163CEH8_9BURK|nr:protein-disulfide reductase DsbD [Hydrogenophaga crassostreae]AOW13364.1 thiol:disulfide interchange protein [Hydrogenophaga crassostreae]OAD41648.1 thiol:disulfide interchange protein [Hydrogenophaga crassostreae]
MSAHFHVLFRPLRWLAWLVLLGTPAIALAQNASVAPSTVSPSVRASESPGPLNAVRSWIDKISKSDKSEELLPPDLAFKIAVNAKDANTLIATLTPAADYYMYRDRISFTIVKPTTISISDVALPQGEPKADPTFGSVQVYHQAFDAVIKLRSSGDQKESVELLASYQGCNEPLGVCYPPIEKTVNVSLLAASVSGPSPPEPAVNASKGATTAPSSDLDTVRLLFANQSRWALVAAFFGFGFLLAFTPCMLPMIPILTGILAGHGNKLTRRHAVGLSAVYVLAMALTYALAGVAAGLAGTLLSAYLQNAWVLGSFAVIFVVLALSMFGLYELQLPTALQTRLAIASGRIKGGKVIGAFLMGVLSAVIVGPCVAAPLAGALLYIGQTHDVVLGGTALFAMAIGMGIPLMVVGATTGSLLPKAGAWTESIKRVFGVTMLATAIYLISPVIPVVAQQLLWAALLIVPAMYLHALDPLPADAPGHRRLFKGIGVLALLMGAAMLLGALSGHREILQPLAGLRGTERVETRELKFDRVLSVADLDARLQNARGRTVMLDFWAEWCVSCKEMDQFTFSDPRVQARLKDTLVLRADVTANNAEDQALLRRFSLFGPPGIIFFDRDGQEQTIRVIGYEPPEQFLRSLDRVAEPQSSHLEK